MEYDEEKVDEAVLALLYLTSFTQHGITRAWKGQDWDVLNRLHEEQGQISSLERRRCKGIRPAILGALR